MQRKLIAVTLALASLGALFVPFESALAITVSPVIFEFEIARGGSRQDTIKLWNDTEKTQTFVLAVQNFLASGEEGAQTYLEEDPTTDLASWVIVDRPAVTLQPGESADFPFVINVPANAAPGGHYATVFFSSAPARQAGGVGIGAKTGVLMLVNVPGQIREEARVESFRLMGGNLLKRLPATFELRIRNLGNTHFRPRGTLVIRNLLGSVVDRVAANPKSSAVLPQSVRRIYSIWTKTLEAPVSGGFWAETKNEWRNFALGRYTAEMDVTYGTQIKKLEVAPLVFWVMPWHILTFVAIGLVASVLLIRLYNAMIVRVAIKRANALAEKKKVARRPRKKSVRRRQSRQDEESTGHVAETAPVIEEQTENQAEGQTGDSAYQQTDDGQTVEGEEGADDQK